MDTLAYMAGNIELIARRTVEHLSIVSVAVLAAILIGVPIGIAITQNRKVADSVLAVATVIITIPSIALFGLMIPPLSMIGQGIGWLPAVLATFLYSLLPIIRNTYSAVLDVDPALREAARGMGMTTMQRLREVELPLAMPVIVAGVRLAVVMTIAIAAIATYIGAGGLGSFISAGIAQSDHRQLLTGALTVSALAIACDYLLLFLQRRLTPPGVVHRP
jgi:osmoprotectant transport system permease protein